MVRPIDLRLLLLAIAVTVPGGCTEYDPTTPDTAANRAGFARHLGQPPSPDVTGVYYYADESAADATFQLRFEADAATIDAIALSLGLSDVEKAPAHGIARDDLSWWPADRIDALRPKWKTIASNDHYWMLWYDPERREAFFLEFTL